MSAKLSTYISLQKELLVLERETEKEEASLATEGTKLSALQSSGVSQLIFGGYIESIVGSMS